MLSANRGRKIRFFSAFVIVFLLIFAFLMEVVLAHDLNGDGVVDGVDLGILLSQWGTCQTSCSADLNSDGVVNGADLAMLLSVWTPGSTTLPVTSCGTLNQTGATYVLKNNLTFSDNVCIIIAANRIKLDGQGYEIRGNGYFLSSAVSVVGYSNITIRDLVIEESGFGVELGLVNNSIVEDITVRHGTMGGVTIPFGSYNNIIRNNLFEYNGAGIGIVGSHNNFVLNNEILYNQENAIDLYGSNNNVIKNNKLSFNTMGIRLDSSSAYNLIEDNEMSSNKFHGIHLGESPNNSIIGNNFTLNAISGLWMWRSDFNTIEENYFDSNGENIFASVPSKTIGLLGSSNNLFLKNEITNSKSDAIALERYWTYWSPIPTVYPSTKNEFVQNTIEETSAEFNDLNLTSTNVSGNIFIDMSIARYNLGSSNTIKIEQSIYGKVSFIQLASGSGNFLTDEIRIESNLAVINASANPGLNKPAEISLYNLHKFTKPVVFDGEELCTKCSIPTSDEDNYTFIVPGAGVYSIAESSKPNFRV